MEKKYVIGHIEFITDNIIEISENLKEGIKVYTLRLSDSMKEQMEKQNLKKDLKIGLLVGCVYNENYEILKLTYLKSNA